MATKINPYLNFDGNAAEAMSFYKAAFGGEFTGNGLMKMSEAPGMEGLPKNEKTRIMHVSLPIGNGDMLMASDIMPSMGQKLTQGNGNYICIAPDSKQEADRLFNALSKGGKVEMPMADQFWGDYFGSFTDKFGVYWMINFGANSQQ